MKFLAVIIIIAGLGLLGTAFFGVYTAPGLEDLPTMKSLNKEKKKKGRDLGKDARAKPKGVIIPVDSKGAMSERNRILNERGKTVAPVKKKSR